MIALLNIDLLLAILTFPNTKIFIVIYWLILRGYVTDSSRIIDLDPLIKYKQRIVLGQR